MHGADDAIARLSARGLSRPDAAVVVDHLELADASGKHGHGLGRIPWLEGLLGDVADPSGVPERLERTEGFERWHGRGALGYLTLAAVCDALLADPPARARLVVCEACFPTGVLGAWARRLADAGLVAVVTATSPKRLPHPDGGAPLTGTNPIAVAVPSSDGRSFVADVSMGAVTHGDVLAGDARPEELVPFGGPQAHKAFALAAAVELLVGASQGRSTARSSSRRGRITIPCLRSATWLRGSGARRSQSSPEVLGQAGRGRAVREGCCSSRSCLARSSGSRRVNALAAPRCMRDVSARLRSYSARSSGVIAVSSVSSESSPSSRSS